MVLTSRANVRYRGQLNNGQNPGNSSWYINELISDVRVGRHTVMDNVVEYQVKVPPGSPLNIELQRRIRTPNYQNLNHHVEVLRFENTGQQVREVDGHRVEIEVTEWQNNIEAGGGPEFITEQPPRPRPAVEVQWVDGHMTLVYTIGDQLSFTEFIISLRRILADHPRRGDVLDGHHKFLNLSCTREHPLLAKPRAEGPARWIHVKLQTRVDGHWYSTTLLMADYDVYIHGFKNQNERTYGLSDPLLGVVCLLPQAEYQPKALYLDVKYESLVGAGNDVVSELSDAIRGRSFMVDAVRVLSSHPERRRGEMRVGKALAGLILMICESARMNPVHDSFARDWTTQTTPQWRIDTCWQLMHRFVWDGYWGDSSVELRKWKRRMNYASTPDNISELLQDIYLVRDAGLPTPKPNPPPSRPGSNHPPPPPGSNHPPPPYWKRRQSHTSGTSGNGSQPHTPGHNPRTRSAPGKGSAMASSVTTAEASPGVSTSRGDDNSPPEEAPGSEGLISHNGPTPSRHGRPRVELLAIKPLSADLGVPGGTKITVFDGKRGQIVYCKEEQGGQEGVDHDLVLTGPYTGISAEYGCFAIRIDTPKTASSSSSGDMVPLPIRWEWDCDVPEFAEQVDALQPSDHTICTPDGAGVAKVTYAVMSNALDASVQVKLLLSDDEPSPAPAAGVYGEITAYIGEFTKGSKLFSREKSTKQRFSSTDSRTLELDLARSVVAVRCDWALRIEVALEIETSNTTDATNKLNTILIFDNGALTATDGQVEANVTWCPEVKNFGKKRKRDFTGPDEGVKKFQKIYGAETELGINNVRVLKKKFGQDKQIHDPTILSGSEQDQRSKTSEVISGVDETGESSRRNQAGKVISDMEETAESSLPAEAKLETGHLTVEPYTIGDAMSFDGFITDVLRHRLADNLDRGDILDSHYDTNLSSTREHPLLAKHHDDQPERWLGIKLQPEKDSSATTLFVGYTNLYCLGFRNHFGVCYELTNPEGWKLPPECNAVPLDWGITYESILNASDEEEVVRILDGARLGKAFVADAVRRLSSSIPPDDQVDGMMSARLALAGLRVMFIESARMNPLRDAFVSGWDTRVRFTKLLMEYMQHWELLSDALLGWKDEGYRTWTIHPKLAEITGVKSYEDALKVVNLVRNFTMKQRQLLHQVVYGS